SASFSSHVGIQELFLVCDTLSMPSGAQHKTGTHHPRSGSSEKQVISRLYSTGIDAVRQGNRNGRCRAVAILTDNVDGPLRRNAEELSRFMNDPGVCLMWYPPVDRFSVELRHLHGFNAGGRHGANRLFEE